MTLLRLAARLWLFFRVCLGLERDREAPLLDLEDSDESLFLLLALALLSPSPSGL